MSNPLESYIFRTDLLNNHCRLRAFLLQWNEDITTVRTRIDSNNHITPKAGATQSLAESLIKMTRSVAETKLIIEKLDAHQNRFNTFQTMLKKLYEVEKTLEKREKELQSLENGPILPKHYISESWWFWAGREEYQKIGGVLLGIGICCFLLGLLYNIPMLIIGSVFLGIVGLWIAATLIDYCISQIDLKFLREQASKAHPEQLTQAKKNLEEAKNNYQEEASSFEEELNRNTHDEGYELHLKR